MYDVIIPARNEEKTIGAIVRTFKLHPQIAAVIVIIDDDTTDNTADVALGERAIVVYGRKGKGQNVKLGFDDYVVTDNVILCDADYTGLLPSHIDQLILNHHVFVIGVPDFPLSEVLMSAKMTWEWMPRIFETYAWVSGIRKVNKDAVYDVDFHGYLTEVQINAAYKNMGIEPEFVHLHGLYSPFVMNDKRIAEMLRDRQWGEANGVFGR